MNDITESFLKNFKNPPHSIKAEQAVIAGLLIDNSAFEKVNFSISSNDFFLNKHKIIYDSIRDILNKGEPLDIVTLSEKLSINNVLNNIGGFVYLNEILNSIPNYTNISSYVEIVKKKSLLREIIRLSQKLIEYGYNNNIDENIDELIDFAESNLIRIHKNSANYNFSPRNIVDILKTSLKDIKNIKERCIDSSITGIDTGYKELNKKTLGLQNSDLIVIAGRPSMGKTTLAMNICVNAALSQHKPILIFSLEMQAEQIAKRILASLGNLEHEKIKAKKFNKKDWKGLALAYKTLCKAKNIYIDDSPDLTLPEIKHKITKIYKEYKGLGLVVIDYLQLIKSHHLYNNRNLEITNISRTLKSFAKALNIPIITNSQLNRCLELRKDKRPINSDLRESGAIEQDADLIIFIYRDELYNVDTKMKGLAEIIIGKQRNGPVGSFFLRFNEKFARFEETNVIEIEQ